MFDCRRGVPGSRDVLDGLEHPLRLRQHGGLVAELLGGCRGQLLSMLRRRVGPGQCITCLQRPFTREPFNI